MSFDVNPLKNTPQFRATQTQDGSAGNAGYFKQEKKNEEKNENEKSVFGKNDQKDSFTLKDAANYSYAEPPFLLKIVMFIKSKFKELLDKFI